MRKFVGRIDVLFGLSRRPVLGKRGGVIPIGGLLGNFYAERELVAYQGEDEVRPDSNGDASALAASLHPSTL